MIDPAALVQAPEEPARPPARNLDIACGQAKQEGWIGIDISPGPGVDIVHDLFQIPWPIESESIDEIRCSHFFEHVPGKLRPAFMSEVWRILKPGAGAVFVTPRGYDRQVQDFSHEWPPVVQASYVYYDRAWLKANNLDHYIGLYGIDCNFELRPLEISVYPDWQGRHDEHKVFAVTHYQNAALDLFVLLVKKPLQEPEGAPS